MDALFLGKMSGSKGDQGIDYPSLIFLCRIKTQIALPGTFQCHLLGRPRLTIPIVPP